MIVKITKLFSNPKKYFPLIFKIIQQQFCGIFQNSAFFMQGQMDISPKARWRNDEFCLATGGFYPANNSNNRQICNLEPWDNTRRDMLILLLRTIVEKNIAGEMAELGVYQGHTAKLIHYYVPEKKLFLFDTFEGFTKRSVDSEKENTNYSISETEFSDTSIEKVKRFILQKNDNVSFHIGYFPESIPESCLKLRFSFVHLDADLYEPIYEGLKFFYSRMTRNGLIIVHDYNSWPGARKAVDDFFKDKNVLPIPMPDKSGSVLIINSEAN